MVLALRINDPEGLRLRPNCEEQLMKPAILYALGLTISACGIALGIYGLIAVPFGVLLCILALNERKL